MNTRFPTATVSTLLLLVAACQPAEVPKTEVVPAAQMHSFELSPDSLKVDRIGLKALRPDGSRDLVFSARVTGPARALLIASANEQCDPGGTFRASTLLAEEPAPAELGGALELGRMSSVIGVEEQGQVLNKADGTVSLGPGAHDLRLYVPNLGVLRPGLTLCAYAVSANGTVARSRPLRY